MNNFKKQLKIAYDADAKRRDSAEGKRDQWKLDIRQKFTELLKQEQKLTILELGSGAGLDAKYFQDNGFKVVATDLSEEMVRMCKKRGLDAKVMDLYDLSSLKVTFDAIFSLNVLLHVPRKDLNTVLRDIHNVLSERGIFYYGVYSGMDEEKTIADEFRMNLPRLFSFLSDQSLLDTVEDLFEVIDFETINIGSDKPDFHFQSLLLRRK